MPEAKTFSSYAPLQSPWAESQSLELKASFGEWKEIIQCLAAFANAQGGKVVVGADDAGQPTGLEIGKSTIEDFLNKVRLNTDPVLYPSVAARTFGPCEVVEILVEENQSKPVFAFGRAFLRVGKTTQKLSAQAVKEMARVSLPGDFDTRFTKTALNGWELDERAEKRLDIEKLSEDDRLVQDGKISTGLYLAGSKRNRLYEQAVVKAGLFKGTTTSRFLDMKEFDGSLLSLVEETMEFVARHLSMAVVLDGAPQRKEVWEIPMAAVREAVVKKESLREGVNEGVNFPRLLDLVRKEPGLRSRQIALRMHASPKSVERWLAQLRSKELIEFRGVPKTGGYFARKPGDAL
jgi:ATP-dependent DNA helicase RecG